MNSERLKEILPSIQGLYKYLESNSKIFAYFFGIEGTLERWRILEKEIVVSVRTESLPVHYHFLYEDVIKWMKEREGVDSLEEEHES